MSLPYTMVFTVLMAEMITFIFLVLPLPFKWRRGMLNFLSKSQIVGSIQYAIKILFIFVFILFIDSFNRVMKVEVVSRESDRHIPHIESNVAAKRFYAQRNMYLTGFTLFLSLILNRTFVMIIDLLRSEEKMEIVKKQADQQAKEYERVVASEKKLKKELKDLQDIASGHESAKNDLENLKKKTSQQQEEYLRMVDENTALGKKLKDI
ncbi:hypothetical protein BGZ76_006264 [Entomortierella beljakovae]|nr:hypothetical protein BGZ76_006264 [Entomortierella beljakovae]